MKLLSTLRTGVLVAGILFAAFVGQSPPLVAQPTAGGASSIVMAVTQQSGALPSDAAVEVLPMSMRPFYHVFAAFGLAWLLIFGYAVSLRRRMATLEREVEQLAS